MGNEKKPGSNIQIIEQGGAKSNVNRMFLALNKGNTIAPADQTTPKSKGDSSLERLQERKKEQNKLWSERTSPKRAAGDPAIQELKQIQQDKQKTQEPQTRQQPNGDQVKAQEQLRQAQNKNLMSQRIATQRQSQTVPKPEPTKEQPAKQPAQKTTQSRMAQNLQKEARAIKKDTPPKATVMKKAPTKPPPIKGK